jgi:hypothetical protein
VIAILLIVCLLMILCGLGKIGSSPHPERWGLAAICAAFVIAGILSGSPT